MSGVILKSAITMSGSMVDLIRTRCITWSNHTSTILYVIVMAYSWSLLVSICLFWIVVVATY